LVVAVGLDEGGAVDSVCPLGHVTGGGVVAVGRAEATEPTAMASTTVARAAAQPRTGLRVGLAVDMSGGGYGIVLREPASYTLPTAQRPTPAVRIHG
jgi:hypothetical protein